MLVDRVKKGTGVSDLDDLFGSGNLSFGIYVTPWVGEQVARAPPRPRLPRADQDNSRRPWPLAATCICLPTIAAALSQDKSH